MPSADVKPALSELVDVAISVDERREEEQKPVVAEEDTKPDELAKNAVLSANKNASTGPFPFPLFLFPSFTLAILRC
jgi:hypothetical protein